MDIKEIIINGFKKSFDKLSKYEDLLNSINVFPIADQDTGINFKHLFKMINNTIDSNISSNFIPSLNKIISSESRGNSGVIISLYFNGIGSSLINSSFTRNEILNSLIKGSDYLFLNFENNLEGGMPSMISLIKDKALSLKDSDLTTEDCFNEIANYIENNLISTSTTNETLIKSNYVDSGSLALLMIFDSFNEIINDSSIKDYRELIYIKKDDIINDYPYSINLSMIFIREFSIERFIKEISRYGNIINYNKNDLNFIMTMETDKIDTLLFMLSLYGSISSYKITNNEIDNLSNFQMDLFYANNELISNGIKSMNYEYSFSKESYSNDSLLDIINELQMNNINITLYTSVKINDELENKIPRIRYFNDDESLYKYILEKN